MSYIIEKGTGDVVIKGFENGIADSPYEGISDIRNANLVSVPREASVNFSTSQISYTNSSTGSVTSANAGTDTVTYTGPLANTVSANMAITFSAVTVVGLAINTVYWISPQSNNTFKIYSDYQMANLVDLTSDGTGTFTFFTMQIPKHFAYNSVSGRYFVVDSIGQVWSNAFTTSDPIGAGSPTLRWTFTGNRVPNSGDTAGNGLVIYIASDLTQYLFVFHNGSIDYTRAENTNISWVYQWNPATGAAAGYAAVPTQRLKTNVGTQNSHEAIVAPDNKVYYCDANWIGRWYQADPNTAFVPSTPSTYVFDQTQVLPFTDIANCLAPLGNNLLIGGQRNVVYPWDTFSPLPSYPILIAENNIAKLVTVNTNTFIFVGNRGRIYVTNGSQAQLYKKIPDHISGTIEPYFTWGGATSNKNQLYFSASVTTNAGVAITQYGGVWGIDLDTKAIRLTNKLSYGTYAGYATAIISNFASNPSGTGLYIGWNSGASTYGLDTTTSTPYVGGETTIDSDLIPIGTVLQPSTSGHVEFKLAVPLVAGESVQLLYRQKFSDQFAEITGGTFNTAGIYSGVCQSVNFELSQWIQIRAALTGTASNPSYVRLVELRLGN